MPLRLLVPSSGEAARGARARTLAAALGGASLVAVAALGACKSDDSSSARSSVLTGATTSTGSTTTGTTGSGGEGGSGGATGQGGAGGGQGGAASAGQGGEGGLGAGGSASQGAGGSGFPMGPCEKDILELGSGAVYPTGPTQAFVDAYSAAMSIDGPFFVELVGLSYVLDEDRTSLIGGSTPGISLTIVKTELGAEYPVQVSPTRAVTVPYAEHAFHLAFTTNLHPEGDIEVAAIEITGQLDDTCAWMPAFDGALYIEGTQADVPFGGSTLGALLGPQNASIGGGTMNGWKIPLHGEAEEVKVQ